MNRIAVLLLSGCLLVAMFSVGYAQEEIAPVEVDGDQVEFDIQERKVIASGNVSVSKGDVRLSCDRLEYYRDTDIARCEGNVVLERDSGRITGESLTFDFQSMEGDFERPLLTAPPLYGSGEEIEKVGKNHILIHNGYITTCDFDKPQTRVQARRIDVYPGDKAVARDVTLRMGDVPIFYLPRYTKDLKDRRSIVRVTPGYDSDWGAFLLSRWRFDRNDRFKTFWHLDYRERKDLAWGVDGEYKTPGFGNGLFRTYYMNERSITSDRIWDDRPSPTTEQERYKIEWRHKWNIDERTVFISQYYKLSDATFLKDYFEREYEEDANPDTYALLIRNLDYGTASARMDYRANRFESKVERLPELSYNLPSKEIFDTNVYLQNKTTFSNLFKEAPSPADTVANTRRVDADNILSYPAKVSFLDVRPFVGTEHTYYSRTLQTSKQDIVRNIFKTGVDVSTKFYRVFDVQTDRFNLDVDSLRHVITPTVAYVYQDDPTVEKSQLFQYDAIDDETRIHKAVLSLENKLQTKRDGQSYDFLRLILSTEYAFPQDTLPSGYNKVKADLELTPYSWLGFYFDSEYNPQTDDLETANFDLYINHPGDRWYAHVSDRYHHDVDHIIAAEAGWRINPKWGVGVRERFDIEGGKNEETAFVIHRDLHAWLLDIEFIKEDNDGESIMFIFTLKGFEDAQISASTSFERERSEPPGPQG
ncbi:MAG: LPS-assembly protein LptD [Candidatus Omnitrophota bacterium]